MTQSMLVRWCGVLVFMLAMNAAQAAQYCCACKDGAQETVEANDQLRANLQCAVACKRLTLAHSGACAQAPTTAPTAVPAATSGGGGGVMVYRSGDCSGDPLRLSKSTAQLEQGAFYSYAVDSGAPASAFAQANYAGMRTQPVAASICVSPGFPISAIRVGND